VLSIQVVHALAESFTHEKVYASLGLLQDLDLRVKSNV
jgi:hypothetical protein